MSKDKTETTEELSAAEKLHAGLNDIIIAVNEEGKIRLDAEASGNPPSHEERLQSYARVIGVVAQFSKTLQDEICNVVFDGDGNVTFSDAEAVTEGDGDA